MSKFLNAIVRAGRAFKAVDGKDPEVEGGELAEHLLSDQPLSRDDRLLLAELVTGHWRRPQGRPSRVGPGHPYAKAIVEFYNQRNSELGPRKKKIALHDTAEKFDESERTIGRYLEEARERASAIERAEARIAK